MDGERFDVLIKGLGSRRLTRLRALQGLAAATAIGLTGVSVVSQETEAARRRRTICHCGDNNPQQIGCVTKRIKCQDKDECKKKVRRHLRRHDSDYKGKCVEPTPTPAPPIGSSCLSLPPGQQCPGGDFCCPAGTKRVGTCRPNENSCG